MGVVVDVHANSKNLIELEECISKIRNNDLPLAQCDRMCQILSLEFKPVTVESITIVKTDDKTPAFGSRVFPSRDHLRQIIDDNINERKSNVILERCVIELEDRLFTKFNLSDRQIVAILLHEIGHCLSDRELIKPKAILASVSSTPLSFAPSFNQKLSEFLLSGLGVYYISQKLINNKNNRVEIEADSVAVACGYGEELAQALGQLSHFIKNDPVSSLSYAQAELKWGIDAMFQFEQRQAKIKQELIKREKQCKDSPYLLSIVRSQIALINHRNEQKKRRLGVHIIHRESKLEESCNLYLESIFRNNSAELEADLIAMEIGRIETTDDKLYLTSRVHKSLVIAKKSLDKIAKRNPNDPRIPIIQANIKKLEDLIPQIKAVKTDINPFIIRVAYPEDDYER